MAKQVKEEKREKDAANLAFVMGKLAKGEIKKIAQDLRANCKHEETFQDNGKTYCSNCWAVIA